MDLYKWQQTELDQYGAVPKRAIFAAPRTGKTRLSALLVRQWAQKFTVITSPRSVCPSWVEEIASLGLTVIKGYEGTIASIELILESKPSGVLIINDDRIAALERPLLKAKPQAIVGDESHRYRGVTTAKAKTMRKLCWQAKFVRLLSGTPAPQHHGNLWGQMVCLDKDQFFPSYSQFAERYLIRDSLYKNVIGVVNLADLMEKVGRYSTVVKREDVFGPDTWQTVIRNVEIPGKARKIYDDLAYKWIHESENTIVSTGHVLTRLLRMQQIASGYVRLDDGTIQDLHRSKIDAVMADLEDIIESGEKAVIFHKFTWEATAYVAAIKYRFGFVPHTLNGSSSPGQRAHTIDAINNSEGPQIAVVQTQAGGTGVSFAGATHALFVSQLFNYDDEMQARDRVYKPGSSRCVTYYRATRTVDEYIARALEQKQTIHESVVNHNLEGVLYGV